MQHRFSFASLFLVALLFGVGLAPGVADAKKVDEFLSSAEEESAAGRFQAAVIHLKNAVQADPENAEARRRLGEVYLKLYAIQPAEKELRRARALGDESAALRASLARAQLLLGRFDEVLALTDEADAPTGALRDELDVLRVQALSSLGQQEAALSLLDAVMERGDNAAALEVAARLDIAAGRLGAAKQKARRAHELDPANSDAVATYARLLVQDRALEEAYGILTPLVAEEPFRPDTTILHSSLALELRRFEEARAAIAAMPRQIALTPASLNLQALLSLHDGDYETALAQAEQALGQAEDYAAAQRTAGFASLVLGKTERGREYLSGYVGRVPQDQDALLRLAWAETQLGNPEKAYDILTRRIFADSESEAYLRLAAEVALRVGKPAESQSFMQRYVALRPDDVEARSSLGLLQFSQGERELALQALEDAAETAPDSVNNLVRLGTAQLGSQDFEGALASAKEIQSRFPELAIGFNLEGAVHLAREGQAEARSSLEQALSIEPDNAPAAISLAQLHVAEDEPELARARLDSLLEDQPENVQALLLLARIDVAAGALESAEERIEEAVEVGVPSPVPNLVQARFLLATGRPLEARSAIVPAVEGYPDQPAVWETDAIVQAAAGDFPAAVTAYRQLANLRPEDPQPHAAAAEMLLRDRRLREAIGELRSALDRDSSYLPARFGLVRLLVFDNQHETAFAELSGLAEELPDDAGVAELKAFYYLQAEEDAAKAEAELQRAFDLEPTGPRAGQLAQFLWTQDRRDEALAKLDGWLEAHADDTQIQDLRAQYHIFEGRYGESRVSYQRLVESQPDNAAYRNNLAWALWREGQVELAKGEAERALELAPQSGEIMDTLAVILLDLGETERALNLLEEAMERVPRNPDIQVHYAQALMAAGETERAREMLEGILTDYGDFYERAAAEELLQAQ